MPNTRISDLTAATSVAGTDVYPSVQTAGVGPVKTSLTLITAFALANAPAGAVATPSIAPTGDTNTGFWFPAADTIAASTGGSERLRINSSGDVSIGLTSARSRLHAAINSGAGPQLSGTVGVFENSAAGNNSYVSIIGAFDAESGIIFTDASGGFKGRILYNNANNYLQFNTNGSEKMRIDSSGNVGIGTQSPGAALDVFGNIYVSNATTSGGAALVGRAAGSNTWIVGPDNAINGGTDQGLSLYSYGATNVRFYTNATERMRITSAGNVLIGTTSSPTTGTQCLTIETETAPTATPADTVTFYSSDLSAGNTMPSFYTEGTIVGTGTPTADRTIAVRINGTVYYLLASTIP